MKNKLDRYIEELTEELFIVEGALPGHYSVYDVNHKNKVDQDQSTERWMHYTYRIDLAQKEDKEKYGNKKQVK